MKKIYLLLISFICLNFGYGQTTTTIAAFRGDNTIGATPAIAIANNPASGFTRGPGLTMAGVVGATNYHVTSGWDAISKADAKAKGDYIEWSITVSNNVLLITKITELSMRLRNNAGTGPSKFEIYYSKNDFITETQITPASQTLGNTTFTYSGLNINTSLGDTVKFRLYGWDASNKVDGVLHIANVVAMPFHQEVKSNGSLLKGQVTQTYNGRLFSHGAWYPGPPTAGTNPLLDATILAGTYVEGNNVNIKNLTVVPGAGIRIANTGSITVQGHLITSDNVTVESSATRFGSLMVVNYTKTPFVPAQVTGKVKYSRIVNDRGDNDLISAPVSGQGFMEFWQTNPNLARNNAGTRFIFGPFDKATGDYVISTSTDNYILKPGIGYRAASEDREPLIFNGTVSVGNVSVPIEESGTGYKEWNLIGNPYPAFIGLQAFGGPNLDLLHEEAKGVYGYNPANTSKKWEIMLIGAHAGFAIAPGQGFYVATLPDGGDILFEPTMMLASESDDFITGRTENKDTNSGFLKLNISNEGKNYDTELFFMEQASRGLDPGYDGRVYGKKAEAFAIYSHLVEDSKGTDMAVQSVGYSDLTNGVVIPIGINASEGMQITVNISEFNLPEGTEVRLEDNSNNTFTLLNTSDYTFTATSNLKDIGRFFLHVSTKPLSNKDDILNGLQIYTTNKSKTLYVKGLIKDQAQVNIYDIQGRIMTSASLKANTNSNEVDMSNLSTGIYVAELKSSGSVKTQKVILK